MTPTTTNHHTPILYMGPIRGGTDHIYRNTFADHFDGYDLAVAPFINCIGTNKIRRKYVKGLLPENNTGMPVIPQILSKSAEGFVLLANYLTDMGYDTINWNIGCPYPQVARKQRGSGLLPHTDKIRQFLDTAIPKLHGDLTIKTRLGREHKDELFTLIPVFNEYPVKEIIIHPRTGKQMYEGIPDVEAFETCLSMCKHPVVYNGDIRTADDFYRLSGRFPTITRWMIGRWALVDPYLPMVIKTGKESTTNKIEKMKTFHDDLYNQYTRVLHGPSHIIDRMKGLMMSFSLAFKENKKALKKIKKARTPEQYEAVVHHFFDEEAVWKY
ncbi:MAG: tRNA-dihydrouridine synthase family protein [Desulfobacteraceae bacterium]|nr:tRNA-dihydrouridine synthase family protein [Desulfobacteraceae bacterium]MBC2757386.1 tRNA-dihydrouridine synthase family protein [Desulfobacteraceae bacterium]